MQGRFGTWTLAMGMTWYMPTNSREIKAYKKQHRNEAFVLRGREREQFLGFHPLGAGSAHAAALVVGLVVPNAIVFAPISDGSEGANATEAWVCAIVDGMPARDYDKVLPLDEAHSLANEWISLNSFPKAEMVGALAEARMRLPDVLELLDARLHKKQLTKKDIASTALKRAGLPARRIATALAVAGVCGAGVFAFQAWQDMQRKDAQIRAAAEERARLAADGTKSTAELAGIQKTKLDKFLHDAEAARERYRQGNASPAEMLAAFTSVRQNLPVSSHGYRPQSMDCTAKDCRVQWLGQGRFTSPLDKALLPNVVPGPMSTELTATSVFALPQGQSALPEAPAATPDELRMLMQMSFVAHGNALQVDPAIKAVVLAPPEGVKAEAITVAHVGVWHLRLPPSTGLVDAVGYVSLLSHWPVRVTSIRYTHASSSLELDGEFIFLAASKG
jgi:hypothetical protein